MAAQQPSNKPLTEDDVRALVQLELEKVFGGIIARMKESGRHEVSIEQLQMALALL